MEDATTANEERTLWDLCEVVAAGAATEQEIAELERRICGDVRAARTYLDYAGLHADLLQITSASHSRRAVARELGIETRVVGSRHLAWLVGLVAVLLVSAGVFLWTPEAAELSVLPTRLPVIDGMAVLSRIENVTWSEGASAFKAGQLLRSRDWLAIDAGLVEVEFGQGAVVVLEGPARFTARSTAVGELAFGRLAAVVPPWAEGFRVETAELTVVDLGTKFEVEVTRDDRVDVAVTKGEVELVQSDEAAATSSPSGTRLVEGQAVRVDGGRVETITAEDSLRSLSNELPYRPDHTQAEVIARYRRDFLVGTANEPRTVGPWTYWTNADGPLGRSSAYTELRWDSRRSTYDPNGDQAVLAGGKLYAANLSHRGGHPGAGKDQHKSNEDHYVIAAFEVPRDAVYRIESGWLVRCESRDDIANQAVDLVVLVNDENPVFSATCNRDGLVQFQCSLGALSQGDRVYVAVGPRGVDFNDRFEWDFAVVREIESPAVAARDQEAAVVCQLEGTGI